MAFRNKSWKIVAEDVGGYIACSWRRCYSSKVDFKKLRPMILDRIEKRAKDYPVKAMIPVAREVLQARMLLIQGVRTLLQVFPVSVCKFCPEVYVGEKGHLIQSCPGYRRHGKKRVHEWVPGGLNDILVPVETYKLNEMFQEVIKHDQRFDFDRVQVVIELCRQAGVDPSDGDLYSGMLNFGSDLGCNDDVAKVESLSPENLRFIANGTLIAWETVRSGVERLLLVYPAKVCKYCSEVHVGPSGHKARLCGIFKYQSWRGSHFWEKAGVDDLVPPQIVWRRRPQDPPVLINEGQDFYGHAPAVVDLCTKAGAIAPKKYHCMMKVGGLSSPICGRN